MRKKVRILDIPPLLRAGSYCLVDFSNIETSKCNMPKQPDKSLYKEDPNMEGWMLSQMNIGWSGLCVYQVCEGCHDHDRNDHCAAKECDVWWLVHTRILNLSMLANLLHKPLPPTLNGGLVAAGFPGITVSIDYATSVDGPFIGWSKTHFCWLKTRVCSTCGKLSWSCCSYKLFVVEFNWCTSEHTHQFLISAYALMINSPRSLVEFHH